MFTLPGYILRTTLDHTALRSVTRTSTLEDSSQRTCENKPPLKVNWLSLQKPTKLGTFVASRRNPRSSTVDVALHPFAVEFCPVVYETRMHISNMVPAVQRDPACCRTVRVRGRPGMAFTERSLKPSRSFGTTARPCTCTPLQQTLQMQMA